MKIRILVFVLTALIAVSTSPASAASTPGTAAANFEVSLGAFTSGFTGLVGDEAALSIRGGYRFTHRWGLQGSLSRVELTDLFSPFTDIDGDATFFDISARYFINPRRRAEVFVYGGVGLASFNVEVKAVRIPNPFTGRRFRDPGFDEEDEFTTHLGVGVNIRLSERMYLRPDLKVRWIGSGNNGDADAETSLGLGWKF